MALPIQPLYTDEHGTLRFRSNAIVRYLLDHGGIDMNRLATLPFDDEDRMQFAQLIGYSLAGFGELNYTTNAVYDAAERMAREGITEDEARIVVLTEHLEALRDDLREPMARLFGVHPDDLGREA
jgi:hypothetical protein